MKVRFALSGGFGTTLVAVLGVVFLAFVLLANLTTRWTEMSTVIVKRNVLMQRCSFHLGYATLYFHKYQYEGTDADRFLGEVEMLGHQLTAYGATGVLTDEEARLLKRAKEYLTSFRNDMNMLREMRAAGADQRTLEFAVQAENDKSLALIIRKLTDINGQQTALTTEDIDRQFGNIRMGLLAAALAASAGVFLVWIFSVRAIVRYDRERTGAIDALQVEIGERTRAEAALRETTRVLETLIGNLPGAIFRLRYRGDNTKQSLFFDGSLARIYGTGRAPSPQTDQEFRARFHPDDHELLFVEVPRRLRETGESEQTFRMMRPDGAVNWLRARERVVEYLGDEMITEGLLIDVNAEMEAKFSLERVNRILMTLSQANEALVRATEENELLSEMCKVIVETGGYRMAWVGIAEHDAAQTVRPLAHAGHEDGFLSQAPIVWSADDEPGWEPGGKAISTGQPQVNLDTADTLAKPPWRAAALERDYRSSLALPLRFGEDVFGVLSIHAVEANAFRRRETALFVDLANDLAYGVSAMRERQRRAEMERLLAHSQKMEALGQLAGGIAHDFNNLLGAILGFARFIAEDCDDKNPAHYHAGRIMAAGQRGKALVGQILSFAHKGEIKRERVFVGQLLAEVQTLAGASVPSTTRVTIEDSLPGAVVVGDADSLNRMLLNLCINGHDSLEGHPGTLCLSVRPTGTITLAPGDGASGTGGAMAAWEDPEGIARAAAGIFDPAIPHVSLVVTDSGCGMDAQLLEKVFSPFFTTKGKGGGTGLGLAAVHSIVMAHGGALVVESRPGDGTRFEVVLPLAAAGDSLPAPEPATAPAKFEFACRVLLVDDDSDFADMMLAGLERRGAEVAPCSAPLEALEGFRDDPDAWDILITDQTMPDMTGFDLIREVKKIRPDLPCILCTGFAEDHLDEAVLREADVLARLYKPLEMDNLVAIMAQALDGRGTVMAEDAG